MSKNNKQKAQRKVKKKTKTEKKGLIMSIFILLIMVFSVIGFAFISGNGGHGQQSSSSSSSSNSQTPKEYPLQQVENQGHLYWVAIKNYQQFVFENIDGYEEDITTKGLADKIKSKQNINIYIDKNYQNEDSIFLIQKALKGLEIENDIIANKICDKNTLIFTYNTTLEGNCMKFTFNKEESYKKAEILTYNLIK